MKSAQAEWYNAERVAQPGSVVLREWNAARQAQKISNSAGDLAGLTGEKLLELLGGNTGPTGYSVNESSAMRVSAVYACVRLIAGSIAGLPLSVYRHQPNGDREKADDSPLKYLLNAEPSPQFTAATWLEYITQSIALRGDSYTEIVRRGAEPVALVPHHPDCVAVTLKNGRLQYAINDADQGIRGVEQESMLHVPGFGFNGQRGMSVIRYAAYQSIGIALAADDFSARLYANSATSRAVITAPGKFSIDQADMLRHQFSERYSGRDNVGKPMVLSEGLDIKPISMNATDAQLLEARKYQVIDIARAFGVPPHMIAAQETSSSWGTGIEQLTIGFVKFSLSGYLNRIQQEFNRKLFTTRARAGEFCEFNLEGLLKGDSAAEAAYMRQAIGGSQGPGWMTVNEARRFKNLPPIDGGDQLYDPKGTDNAPTPAATPA